MTINTQVIIISAKVKTISCKNNFASALVAQWRKSLAAGALKMWEWKMQEWKMRE